MLRISELYCFTVHADRFSLQTSEDSGEMPCFAVFLFIVTPIVGVLLFYVLLYVTLCPF